MATQEQNWWEQDETIQPATTRSGAYPGIIQGQVSPLRLAEEARKNRSEARDDAKYNLDVQKYELDRSKVEQEAADKARKFENARSSASTSLSNVMDTIDKIALSTAASEGWWQTGRSGAFMRGMPEIIEAGSDARDLDESLKTIDANTAFSALNEMRQNSPTGGALGQVTERELDLLKSTIASLNPSQSQEQFLASLVAAKKAYLDKLRLVDPAKADEYQQKPGIRFDDKGKPTLVSVQGEDKREPQDPFGVLPSQTPPGGGNGGGGGFVSQLGQGLAQGTGDIVQGFGDFIGIAGNPINATINTVAGTNLSTDYGQSLRDALGLPENPNKTSSAINRFGAAALTGSWLSRAAGGALSGLVNATGRAAVGRPVGTLAEALPNALSTFGKTPLRDTAAGAASGLGGEIGDRMGGTPGAIVGSLAGGIAGYAGASRASAAMSGERVPNALMGAADELGVTMLPADVGGVGTRMATGGIGMTLGNIPLAEGAAKSVASAQGARGRIASAIGEAVDEVGAGQAARRGFKEWQGTSLGRAKQLDEAISVPADSNVQLSNTRAALEEVTRGMQSNPALSKLWAGYPRLRATLEALTPTDVAPQGRADFMKASDDFMKASEAYNQRIGSVSSQDEIAQARQAMEAARTKMAEARQMAETAPQGGELSWADMRRFRSIVGEIIGQPGIKRDGAEIAAMRKLYAALSSDMEVTAAQAGPKALDEFKRAQRYWRGRESRIDDVFTSLFGKNDNRSDDAVYRQINTWAKAGTSDFRRLATTIRSMPKDEADTIRATIVDRMGNAKPARGGDEVFSPAEFSTQWNGLSGRAKSVLFPDAKHRDALDKFSKVTDAMKRAQEFQNFSRTGLATNLTGTGLVALSGPIGWVTAAAYAGGTFSIGKLLASPRFARIIASEKRLRPEQAGRKFAEQLSVLATREPLIAADARGLQQYIMQTLEASPMRAAAQEEPDRRREPPQ